MPETVLLPIPSKPKTKVSELKLPSNRNQLNSSSTGKEMTRVRTRDTKKGKYSSSTSPDEKLLELDEQIQRRYLVKSRIGKGAYGIVWEAEDLTNAGHPVALKKIFDAFRNDTDAQRTYREIIFLREFGQHPNVIRLINAHRASNNIDIYLTFPLMKTDLHKLIRYKPEVLKENVIRKIFYQILKALKYIHSAEVLHRDLKPANILLDEFYNVKVADFGLARSLNNLNDDLHEDRANPVLTYYVATRWYRAPELLVSWKRYSKAIDMWSVGCILAEMIKRRPLFAGGTAIDQVEIVLNIIDRPILEDVDDLCTPTKKALIEAVLEQDRTKSLSTIFYKCDADTIDIIKGLLVFHPRRRLTVDQAINHDYLMRFRTKSEEITMDYVVSPPLNDNKQLTLDNYRNVIYDVIQNKRLSSAVPVKTKSPRLSLIPGVSKSTIGNSGFTRNSRNISVHTLPKKRLPSGSGVSGITNELAAVTLKRNPSMDNVSIKMKNPRSSFTLTNNNSINWPSKNLTQDDEMTFPPDIRPFNFRKPLNQAQVEKVDNTFKPSVHVRRQPLPWEIEKKGYGGDFRSDIQLKPSILTKSKEETKTKFDPYKKITKFQQEFSELKQEFESKLLSPIQKSQKSGKSFADQTNGEVLKESKKFDLKTILKPYSYLNNQDKTEKILPKSTHTISPAILPVFTQQVKSIETISPAKIQNLKPRLLASGNYNNKVTNGSGQTRCLTAAAAWNQYRNKGVAFNSKISHCQWETNQRIEKKLEVANTSQLSRGRTHYESKLILGNNVKEKTQFGLSKLQSQSPWISNSQSQYVTPETHLTRYPFPSNYFPTSNTNEIPGMRELRYSLNNKKISYDYSKAHGTINASELAELKHFDR